MLLEPNPKGLIPHSRLPCASSLCTQLISCSILLSSELQVSYHCNVLFFLRTQSWDNTTHWAVLLHIFHELRRVRLAVWQTPSHAESFLDLKPWVGASFQGNRQEQLYYICILPFTAVKHLTPCQSCAPFLLECGKLLPKTNWVSEL